MRILFAVNPVPSIFMYLVPLAWSLRTAGHEVVVASQPCLSDEITGTGLTAAAVGRNGLDLLARQRLAEVGSAASGSAPSGSARSGDDGDGDGDGGADEEDPLEADRAGVPEPYDAFDDASKQTWDYLKPRLTGAVRGWHWMDCAPMISGLVDFAQRWKPDLVVWDPLTFSGPIAAKASGAAHARMLFGADVVGLTRSHFLRALHEEPGRTDPFADWFGGYGAKYGFEFSEDMVTGQVTIDQFPDSLRAPAPDLEHLRTRHVPYSRAAAVPRWLHTPSARPRVALTLGLSATEHYNGYALSVGDLITELCKLDIELVATVAEAHQHALGPVPDNARIVPFVPWHSLVPTCSAVVHHAGAATLATASSAGVPQLAIPYHFDQPFLARRLAAHGAGLAIPTEQATGVNVREAVERLLSESAFTDRAAALSDEIRDMPSPNAVVEELEALAAAKRER